MAHIVTIEDDKVISKLIKTAFEQVGHTVSQSSDGKSGMMLLYTNSPDILILDINLPDVSGFTIAKTIRSSSRLKRLPILILTSRNDLDSRIHGLQYADDYLKKPFSIEELIARVAALLRRNQHNAYKEFLALPQDPRELIGESLAHYDIIDLVSTTATSLIYKVYDSKLKRISILKLVPPSSKGNIIQARFMREAKMVSKLNHRNICPVFKAGNLPSGVMYIIMPFLKGYTLKQIIDNSYDKSTPLSISTVLNYTMQIAEGINAAHSHNVIHRDIKPENIFVIQDNLIQLIDFGIAKWLSPSTMELTEPGTMLGTINYIAPEQLKGKQITGSVDCWSLGVVIYEMLSGKTPFASDDETEDIITTVSAILNNNPIEITKLRPDTPPELAKIISKALQKNSARRYPDMKMMLEELSLVAAMFKNHLTLEE